MIRFADEEKKDDIGEKRIPVPEYIPDKKLEKKKAKIEKDIKILEENRELSEEIEDIKQIKKIIDLKTKKIDILFKKKKKFMSKGYELAEFEEPVLQFIRRDNSVEYFEGVKPGKYKINHSDERIGELEVNLPPSKILRFMYGPRQFKGYIQHEDEFSPYPHNVLLDGDSVRIAIDKTLNDVKKWKAEEKRAFGDMALKIGMAVALVVAAIALKNMLWTPPPAVAQTATEVVKNTTSMILNSSIL